MSMLSGQADELRKAALIQGAHARYDVAYLLTDAADTILSLRDRAHELQAENAKLWELANGYEALTATLCNERGCDRCPLDDPEQIVCEHMRLQTCLAELEIGKENKNGMEA